MTKRKVKMKSIWIKRSLHSWFKHQTIDVDRTLEELINEALTDFKKKTILERELKNNESN